ncbi:MAG TPA: hypothetical protein VFF69_12765 [Phycisphaerales bacterium]|nr:hypothetical protein [Phycisphaerales bacterium]
MKRILLLASCVVSIAAIGCQNDGSDRLGWFEDDQAEPAASEGKDVASLVRGWPQASREAAQAMADKYGPPDEATPTMLVWHDSGDWDKSVVYNEEVDHNFPSPHKDVLEQSIAFDASPESFDDLAKFDGSVVLERTKGEISATCHKEEANFLAINLANDVATGQRSVEDARAYLARAMRDFMQSGTVDPYMQGLQFRTVAAAQAGDPDQRASVLAGAEPDR